ncbi:LysR family transcriptional regulator [Paraburkholderia oxyphila]|uniref:LysR family transcriptional regulator n=1 Tax=Paraburkholderia oxyphila TaxID=614212 RepID=UPI000483A1C2|nr:LysR family transcriptional regulator [Paraburkholderia oxyphila]
MGHLEAIKIFTRVAETNSFSKTADLLDLPRGTVSRTIQTLEEQLGVRLLSRSTRQVSVTDAGRIYYECCVKLLADLSEAEAALSSTQSVPSGTVRVDTSGTIAKALIVPSLHEFFGKYPNIEVRLGLADRNIDLIQEGVDCVIRAGALEESSLVARRIGEARIVTCASRDYLRTRGVPESLEDLKNHWAVNYVSARTGKLLPFEFGANGKQVKLTLPSKLSANEGTAYIDAGVRGFGIIQPSRYLVTELLKDGVLQEILPTFRCSPIPLSIVYPHRSFINSATRAFTDWITKICHRNPDLRG